MTKKVDETIKKTKNNLKVSTKPLFVEVDDEINVLLA